MIAQQRLRLIQQLSFVFSSGALITPPQLLQALVPCPPTYHFIHSRHGNSHFWRNVSFFPSLHPLSGNKTFGAIRGAGGTKIAVDSAAAPGVDSDLKSAESHPPEETLPGRTWRHWKFEYSHAAAEPEARASQT